MDRTSRANRAGRLALAGIAAGLLALAGPTSALGAAGTTQRQAAATVCKGKLKKVGGRCAKVAPKKKPKPKVVALPAVAPAPVPVALPAPAPALPAPVPVCVDSGLYGLIGPFLTHLSAAHLQESPLQQVHDLLDTDKYVLIHTAMVDNMLAGLGPVVQSLLNGDISGAVGRLLTKTCTPS
jgi:hypothetical protein